MRKEFYQTVDIHYRYQVKKVLQALWEGYKGCDGQCDFFEAHQYMLLAGSDVSWLKVYGADVYNTAICSSAALMEQYNLIRREWSVDVEPSKFVRLFCTPEIFDSINPFD